MSRPESFDIGSAKRTAGPFIAYKRKRGIEPTLKDWRRWMEPLAEGVGSTGLGIHEDTLESHWRATMLEMDLPSARALFVTLGNDPFGYAAEARNESAAARERGVERRDRSNGYRRATVENAHDLTGAFERPVPPVAETTTKAAPKTRARKAA